MTLALELPMPADQAPEPPATRNTRVYTDILEMAKVICAHEKDGRGRPLKITELLDSFLRGPITERYQRVLDRITSEQTKGRKGKGGQ